MKFVPFEFLFHIPKFGNFWSSENNLFLFYKLGSVWIFGNSFKFCFGPSSVEQYRAEPPVWNRPMATRLTTTAPSMSAPACSMSTAPDVGCCHRTAYHRSDRPPATCSMSCSSSPLPMCTDHLPYPLWKCEEKAKATSPLPSLSHCALLCALLHSAAGARLASYTPRQPASGARATRTIVAPLRDIAAAAVHRKPRPRSDVVIRFPHRKGLVVDSPHWLFPSPGDTSSWTPSSPWCSTSLESATSHQLPAPMATAPRCSRHFPHHRERLSVDHLVRSSSDPADTTTSSAHVLWRSPTSPSPPARTPMAPHRRPLCPDRVPPWDRLCGEPSSPIHLKQSPYPVALL
jgi:hypothetical protein